MRSLLFSLAPHAIGTSQAESLSTFLRRLAAAHVVSPSTLLRELVLKPQRSTLRRGNLIFEPSRMSEALNGANKGSELVLRGLEELTGRRDLGGTTFGPLRSVIEFRSAFRTHRAWCPACLDSDEPYDRLVCTLSLWQVCPTHGCELRDRCLYCGLSHRPLDPSASPGLCPLCGHCKVVLPTSERNGWRTAEAPRVGHQRLPNTRYLRERTPGRQGRAGPTR